MAEGSLQRAEGFSGWTEGQTNFVGASPNGKAAAFGAAICRFESYRPNQSRDSAPGLQPVALSGLTKSAEEDETQKTGGQRDRCKGKAPWKVDPNRNLDAVSVNYQPKAPRCRI